MQIAWSASFRYAASLVGGGIDHRRLNAHLAAGADDPQGDFAAIGYEDLGKHECSSQWSVVSCSRQ